MLLLAFELLGLNVRPIFGLRGRRAGLLAFERGQTTIDFQTSTAYVQNVLPLVESGDAIPLFSLGVLDSNGRLVRDPTFPDLPHFVEVYQQLLARSPRGVEWKSWLAFYSAAFGAQKLLVVPKETPETIVLTYQEALASMQQDADYIDQKAAAIGAYDQAVGSTAERLYRMATAVDDDAKRWIRSWLRRQYQLNI